MAFNNQGSRPNYMSTIDPIQLEVRPYNDDNHTIWTGGAVKFVSKPTELDFDLPRIFVSLYCTVSIGFSFLREISQWNSLSTKDQEHLISNVIGHLGRATDERIKKKQCLVFAHVNATLGQQIASGINITLA